MSSGPALRRLLVGSRRSPLSTAQTEEVLASLRASSPGVEFAVVPITTGGDRNKDAPLLSLGRGTFVKEIEQALLDGRIDFAVHSAKDLPPDLPDGLTLAAIGERKDPRDVLVDKWRLPLAELPAGARIGTSSPRRTAQIKAQRPDIEVRQIRGNVGTRLEKARGHDYDGVVLAAAGLLRLGKEAEIMEYLSPETYTPEVGQGMLAVEARSGDHAIVSILAAADHPDSRTAFRAERAFLQEIGGGCKVPVTAYARLDSGGLLIDTMAALPDGSRVYRAHSVEDAEDPEAAGRRAAQALRETGASEIMDWDED